jgi:hypothetical protein
MRKILLSILTLFALIATNNLKAQCTLDFANLVITPSGPAPNPIASDKCEYVFNASFDIKANSGFKYLFFHSWLVNDYPTTPIFDCGNSNAQDPGTKIQLGTAVDQAGKSFLDIGFLNLNALTFAANTAVNVTANFATSYIHDPDVILTQPSNSPGLNAVITRKGTTDTLHFDVTNIRIVVNAPCGPIPITKTDIWASNSNANDPKAQCYICGLGQSFNDPSISFFKICATSPFQYDIGLQTSSTTFVHAVYRIYAHDPLLGPSKSLSDVVIYTSDTITFKAGTPYDPPPQVLPSPYCCIEPWAGYDLYVTVTARPSEFTNSISTPLVAQSCATLPVNLKSFSAVRTNNSTVNLKWETAQEENSKGFDVLRMLSNGVWQPISFVETKAVNGNSGSPLSYEFTDLNNAKGITQYRLRQLDVNGKQSYSLIRSVRGVGQKGKTIVYPNPSNDGKVNVVFEDKDVSRNVSLTDGNGRVIKQWKNVLSNTLQIENLFTGFYTLRIINSETGEQIVEKIVVKNR